MVKAEFKINPVMQLLLAAVILALAFIILPLGYETNDDIGMELAYSGHYSGSPEYGSLYNHFIFGKCLSALYRAAPQFNWYGWIHLSILFLSVLLIIWHVIKTKWTAHSSLWLSLIVIGGFLNFIVQLNFATVAFLSGFIAIFYLLENAFDLSKITFWLALLLIALSLMIRQHFFILAFLMNGPVIISKIKTSQYSIHIKLLIIALIYYLLNIGNFLHYKDKGAWCDSHQKYNAMAYLLDNPCFNMYYLRPHLNTIEWTENDYTLFKHFYFDLPGNLTLKKLHYLNEVIPRDMMDYNEFFPAMFHYLPAYMLLFIPLSWLFSYFYFGGKHLFYNLIFFGIIIGFLFYLTGNKYIFKPRMINSIFIGTISSCYFTLGIRPKRTLNLFPFLLISISILAFSVVPKIQFIQKLRTELAGMNAHLESQYKNKDIMEFYYYYPVCGFKSYLPSVNQMPRLKFLPSGWLINTPLGHKTLRTYGYSSLSQALINAKTVHLLPEENEAHYKEMLRQYYLQYFHLKIKFTVLEQFKTNLQTWKVMKVLKDEV